MNAPTSGRSLLTAALCVLVAACSDGEAPSGRDLTEEPAALSMEQLGALGGRIYLAPDRAAELVQEAGMTPGEFESRVREVTNDPEASLVYADAFEAELKAAEEDAEATTRGG